MSRKIPVVLVPLLLWHATISHADPSEPSNFDECIIDAMRGVSSDVAAQAIIDSCHNLFPEPRRETAPQAAPADDAPTAAAAGAVAPATPAAAPPAPVPIDTANARSLTADELTRVHSRASIFGSAYRVTVENGNPDLTLTEVTIAVWDDNDAVASRKEYSQAVQIAPQASALVKYTVHYRGDETGWQWGVVAARGVE